MNAPSALGLLHPRGGVDRILLLGDAIPPGLVPSGATAASSAVDLAIIAPCLRELQQRDWLGRAARRVAAALDGNGLAYAVLPRPARPGGSAGLRDEGLVIQVALAQLPAAEDPRYLVPLEAAPWRYSFGSVIAARPAARRLLWAAERLPLWDRCLSVALPSVGLLAQRPDGAPPAAWVAELDRALPQTTTAVVASSWRGPSGATVLYCFSPGEPEPWGVVKVTPAESDESELLARLGPGGRDAGARVPRRLAGGQLRGASVVAETVVGGRPAAGALARSPARVREVTAALTGWLERWNVATARRGGGARRLRDELLGAADALGPLLPDWRDYRERLAARCDAVQDAAVPLVASHNDLTMWNVVLDGRGQLGILDWGEAEDHGLPLTDFFYTVVDAVAAGSGYGSRLRAVQSAFPPAGGGAAAAAGERLRKTVGVSSPAAELCFHACWLRHARNEARTGDGGAFLEIARWLARSTMERPG